MLLPFTKESPSASLSLSKAELALISINQDMWPQIFLICGRRSYKYVAVDPPSGKVYFSTN